MATVQKNGSSAVTATSTVNNGGVMTANGSSAANVLRSEPTAAANKFGVFASTVVSGVNAEKALNAGTFAYNEQSPVGPKLTTTLAGTVNNSFLRSGADDNANRRSIHYQTTVTSTRTTTAIRANKWNEYAGTWEAGFPVTATDQFFNPATSGSSATTTDEAALPTASVPGELVYLQGNPVPKLANYESKTSY